MKVAVCTSGGDCAGLNAAIASIVKYGSQKNRLEIYGLLGGFETLRQKSIKLPLLTPESVHGLVPLGGTILGTSNKGSPFNDPETRDQVIDEMIRGAKHLGLKGLFVIGGEGSHGMVKYLRGHGLKFVGIGKTIDNDMPKSDLTIGFKTAVDVARQAAENLITTAKSHQRAMFLEVMGRDSGFLALETGLASEADIILLPEIPIDLDQLVRVVQQKVFGKQGYALGIVAEGAVPKNGRQIYQKTGSKKVKLGGVADYIVEHLWDHGRVESRAVKLGHIQRGGVPNAEDRLLAQRLGVAGVEAMLDKNLEDTLVLCRNGKIYNQSYDGVIFKKRRHLQSQDPLIQLARNLGIFIGDRQGVTMRIT